MIKKVARNKMRMKRHFRIRKNLAGTETCPRLNVFRSNTNIYAQVIDDNTGNTLVSYSTLSKDFEGASKANIEAAKAVGTKIGELAVAAGITTVVFDRGGYLYHGKVQALADAAREAGLIF